MNPNTGKLYASFDDAVKDGVSSPVVLDGPDEEIAKVSAAVRALEGDENEESLAQAREQAMEELRALNKHERNRGRS